MFSIATYVRSSSNDFGRPAINVYLADTRYQNRDTLLLAPILAEEIDDHLNICSCYVFKILITHIRKSKTNIQCKNTKCSTYRVMYKAYKQILLYHQRLYSYLISHLIWAFLTVHLILSPFRIITYPKSGFTVILSELDVRCQNKYIFKPDTEKLISNI